MKKQRKHCNNCHYATIDISEDGLTVAKYQDSEQIAFPKEFVQTQSIEFQEISDFSERP